MLFVVVIVAGGFLVLLCVGCSLLERSRRGRASGTYWSDSSADSANFFDNSPAANFFDGGSWFGGDGDGGCDGGGDCSGGDGGGGGD